MGLDISVYRQIKKIECNFDEDGEPIDKITGEPVDNYRQFFKNPHFPGRADEIEANCVYDCECSDYWFYFSYGGYNQLRNQLAKIAGYPKKQYERFGQEYDTYCLDCWNGETGPFSELINFSDCEGVIGASVSAKLAKDFADFQSKAEAENDKYFLDFYNKMKIAFEIASDSGVVVFN